MAILIQYFIHIFVIAEVIIIWLLLQNLCIDLVCQCFKAFTLSWNSSNSSAEAHRIKQLMNAFSVGQSNLDCRRIYPAVFFINVKLFNVQRTKPKHKLYMLLTWVGACIHNENLHSIALMTLTINGTIYIIFFPRFFYELFLQYYFCFNKNRLWFVFKKRESIAFIHVYVKCLHSVWFYGE